MSLGEWVLALYAAFNVALILYTLRSVYLRRRQEKRERVFTDEHQAREQLGYERPR